MPYSQALKSLLQKKDTEASYWQGDMLARRETEIVAMEKLTVVNG